ncbi:hypothetical protein [Allorhizocola rhizosphaerae]|uniref:hypothetical protein n=1 Tax=Allorhizocola rhizosphaerae TaxID=1872709 RepID=UPI001B8D7059|nr:hypothetical protein [Allorhizocola rhizosphaerae]
MSTGQRVIAFTVRWLADRRVHDIVPTIDDQPLLDLIDQFELDAGMHPAGGAYGGLIPAFYRYGPLDEHFLGKENPGLGPKTAVLACECGEVGCWPLMTRITPTGNLVVWNDFAQPHRPTRDYTTFGPFLFDRDQYDSALAALAEDIATTEE